MRKNQHVKRLRFSLNTNKYKYPKNCPLAIGCSRPWFQVFVPSPIQNSPFRIQNKTHLSGPPMPKFEANMNYIPPSPPSSKKQCNKSATVKFHMELLLQFRSGATPSVSELATVYYYTRRSMSDGCQSTSPGNQAWCIIAPLERYSGYSHFQ